MGIAFHIPSSVEPLTFDDDFTGTNGDPWNTVKWDILSGSPEIQSNKGRQEVPGGGGGAQNVRAYHNYILPAGEFDIQADWDIVSNNPNGDYWVVTFMIFAQAGTATPPYDQFYFQLSRLYSQGAHRLRVSRYDGDPLQGGYQETANTATSGKFRFTRTASNNLHGFWDVGGGWVEYWDTMWGTPATFEVQLRAQNGNGNGEVVVDWDNLISV